MAPSDNTYFVKPAKSMPWNYATEAASKTVALNKSNKLTYQGVYTNVYTVVIDVPGMKAGDTMTVCFIVDTHERSDSEEKSIDEGFSRSRNKQNISLLNRLPEIAEKEGLGKICYIFGGDLLTKKPSDFSAALKSAFTNLSKSGEHAVWVGGNKEDEIGRNDAERAKNSRFIRGNIDAAGFKNIENSFIEIDSQGKKIVIYGYSYDAKGKQRPMKLPEGLKPDVLILVSHDINNIPKKDAAKADLILSGHWHGGELAKWLEGALEAVSSKIESRVSNIYGQKSELVAFPNEKLTTSVHSKGMSLYHFNLEGWEKLSGVNIVKKSTIYFVELCGTGQ